MVNDQLVTDPVTPETLTLTVDGREPLSRDVVAAVVDVCDAAEDLGGSGRVLIQVSGSPPAAWADGLSVALVSRWERALKRLEHLPATTLVAADGDCGGTALDVLVSSDYRAATATVRLLIPLSDGCAWPGMTLYRLSRANSGATAIRRAVLYGLPIDASEALALHLIDRVDPDLIAARTALDEVGQASSRLDGTNLAIRRRLMLDAPALGFDEALGAHLAACDRVLRRSVGAP